MKQGIVTDIDLFGQGIIKDEGKCVFVENALVGEKVTYEIVKNNKKFAKAVAVDILEPVSARGKAPCPYYGACGGCCWQHCDYETEAAAKESHVLNLLNRIGGLDVKGAFQAMDREGEVYAYRNKVSWQVNRGRLGFYRKNSRDFLPIKKCLLLEEPLEKASDILRGLDLRNVTSAAIRCNSRGDISCFLGGKVCDDQIKAITQALPGLMTLEANGKIYGNKPLVMSLGDKNYALAPRSFFQVNTAAALRMLDHTKELLESELGMENQGVLLDLYCGVGAIGIYLSGQFSRVVGVESFAEAVQDAAYNAKANGVEGVFLKAKTEEVREKLAEAGLLGEDAQDTPTSHFQDGNRRVPSPRVIVVDPPRSGLTPEAIDLVESLTPDHILYISCDPGTLSRDLSRLTPGYTPKSIKPFNLFPRTASVETVCLLSKLHSDQHIEVELQMDELDLTAAESKATYEEIKAYVKEHTGLKVSSLYIAQVKQKCGIIERTNHNLPKSENSRQPKCPPEKEAAIREALEHFRMI